MSNRSDIRRHQVLAIARFPNRTVTAENRKGSSLSSMFSIHAEEMLLRRLHKLRAISRWGIPSVTVLRFKRDGSYGVSKPCPPCMKQLLRAGIRKIQYTGAMGLQWHSE